MNSGPGAWTRYRYGNRTLFVDQWRDLSAPGRAAALRYWIGKAATDAWAHRQLCDLAAAILEAGETPPDNLLQFAAEVLRGNRAPPRRRGPKGDVYRDHRMLRTFVGMTDLLGMPQREAARFVGGRMRPRLSPEAVLSAVRRARRVINPAK